MKKIAVLLIAFAFLFLSACIAVAPATAKIIETTQAKPQVITYSSCWVGSARGKFIVTASDIGKISEGRAYCEKRDAIANPIEIKSNGKEIKVTLVDTGSAVEETLEAGEDELLVCDSGSFNGYIYVIVT